MELIDALTILAALIALNNAVYFASQLRKRRYGVYILFALSVGMALEYGRTVLASGFDMAFFGYGSVASYVTRTVVVVALLAVNYIIVQNARKEKVYEPDRYPK